MSHLSFLKWHRVNNRPKDVSLSDDHWICGESRERASIYEVQTYLFRMQVDFYPQKITVTIWIADKSGILMV